MLSEEEQKVKDEQTRILTSIINKAYEEIDILASYQHYLVFGEIKLIRKSTAL